MKKIFCNYEGIYITKEEHTEEHCAPCGERCKPNRVLLNITSHVLTAEQGEGFTVRELPPDLKAAWANVGESVFDLPDFKIFHWIENLDPVQRLSKVSTTIVVQGHYGATYRLVSRLKAAGYCVVYAVSRRESTEKVLPDGSTEKVSIFRHIRFSEY